MENRQNNKISDQELIERFLNDELEAFNILYERYKRQIYAYLNRLLPGQHAIVDDIFQQSWIKVVRQLPKYKHNEKFFSWVMRISHNLTIDHFRKTRHEEPLDDTDDKKIFIGRQDDPWRELDRKEQAEILEQCIRKLPPEQREVILLRKENIGFKEIAKIQNCSINTVLGRMQYALQNLRKHMFKEKLEVS